MHFSSIELPGRGRGSRHGLPPRHQLPTATSVVHSWGSPQATLLPARSTLWSLFLCPTLFSFQPSALLPNLPPTSWVSKLLTRVIHHRWLCSVEEGGNSGPKKEPRAKRLPLGLGLQMKKKKRNIKSSQLHSLGSLIS